MVVFVALQESPLAGLEGTLGLAVSILDDVCFTTALANAYKLTQNGVIY